MKHNEVEMDFPEQRKWVQATVLNQRVLETLNSGPMAIVELDYGGGEIGFAAIFPEPYEIYAKLVKNGALLKWFGTFEECGDPQFGPIMLYVEQVVTIT